MVVAWHRPTRAVIHTKAITENVKNEVDRLPKGKELFAVVKANGYGHGAIETAEAAVAGGASGFCVSNLDEGVELREAGFTQPILILNMDGLSKSSFSDRKSTRLNSSHVSTSYA